MRNSKVVLQVGQIKNHEQAKKQEAVAASMQDQYNKKPPAQAYRPPATKDD